MIVGIESLSNQQEQITNSLNQMEESFRLEQIEAVAQPKRVAPLVSGVSRATIQTQRSSGLLSSGGNKKDMNKLSWLVTNGSTHSPKGGRNREPKTPRCFLFLEPLNPAKAQTETYKPREFRKK